MAEPFLDTNIVIRHLTGDHPQHSPLATAIIGRIERGDLVARTSATVLFEAVFLLERTYRMARARIAAEVLDLLQMPGIVLPGKAMYQRVFDLYVNSRLGFADSYHVALMERLEITEIFSFDTDFDRVSGISRREA